MSKQAWLAAYEQVERDNPDATEDQLNALAEALVIDRMAAKADELRDQAKYDAIMLPVTDKCQRFGTTAVEKAHDLHGSDG